MTTPAAPLCRRCGEEARAPIHGQKLFVHGRELFSGGHPFDPAVFVPPSAEETREADPVVQSPPVASVNNSREAEPTRQEKLIFRAYNALGAAHVDGGCSECVRSGRDGACPLLDDLGNEMVEAEPAGGQEPPDPAKYADDAYGNRMLRRDLAAWKAARRREMRHRYLDARGPSR